ncbi:MAG: glyoxylate/hydroxypyruvate reductase A [Rhodospirillales bacterium]
MASPEDPLEVVVLCERNDLIALFGPHVAAEAPWIALRRPEEVNDPKAMRFALGWLPSPERLRQFPNLELICTIGAGADGLLRIPGLSETVKISRLVDDEQALMMAGFAAWQVVWHHRGMARYLRQQREVVWDEFNKQPPSRMRIGILGYGRMGKAVAKTLGSMGYPLSALVRKAGATHDEDLGVTLHAGAGGLRRIAAECDMLINVLPLTAETEGLLCADFFAIAKRGAYIVNLGRGPQLVEADLIAALDSGQLGGAALDVFDREPLPPESPLWRHPKVLVTPHVASEAADNRVLRFAASEFERYLKGQPLRGLIDRSQGY